jgi:HSP20 family molecular chaperone IbpA
MATKVLVHPNMPPTSTPRWEIKEDNKTVKITLFKMPEAAKAGDFDVAVEDDVLVIRSKTKLPQEEGQGQPDGGISLDVRLLVPGGYDRENVRAELQLRALVVTVPKANPEFTKHKQVTIEEK